MTIHQLKLIQNNVQCDGVIWTRVHTTPKRSVHIAPCRGLYGPFVEQCIDVHALVMNSHRLLKDIS